VLLTFGHGTESADRTAELLRAASVALVVDIRIAPGSRRNPHFAKAELERWLPEAGIGYRWEKRLGGYRKPSPGNPDIAWREDMYRGYAEHMRGPDFLAAIGLVLADAAAAEDTTVLAQVSAGLAETSSHHLAVMCSESSWQHCHRRLLADFARVARDVPVRHLAHDGSLAEHVPSAGLRLREDGLLIYDYGQPPLLPSQDSDDGRT
jgi:uncharacterized protein (DUF488 family)